MDTPRSNGVTGLRAPRPAASMTTSTRAAATSTTPRPRTWWLTWSPMATRMAAYPIACTEPNTAAVVSQAVPPSGVSRWWT